jgi:hypothetical protein
MGEKARNSSWEEQRLGFNSKALSNATSPLINKYSQLDTLPSLSHVQGRPNKALESGLLLTLHKLLKVTSLLNKW